MVAFIDEDMNILHFNTFVHRKCWVSCCSSQILCKKWKTFVMYWWFAYFTFWNSVLGVTVRTSLLIQVWLPCPSSTFTGLTGYPKSCGGFSLTLHGLRNTKLTGLAFAGTRGFGFAIGALEVASWPLFGVALCFPIGSKRKLLKWLQERTSRNSLCWTNEEHGSTRHAWNFLWSACQQVGFGCQHIWFGSWGPSWFCQKSSAFFLFTVILIKASLSSRMYS